MSTPEAVRKRCAVLLRSGLFTVEAAPLGAALALCRAAAAKEPGRAASLLNLSIARSTLEVGTKLSRSMGESLLPALPVILPIAGALFSGTA